MTYRKTQLEVNRYPYTVHWDEDYDRTMVVTGLCRRCEKAAFPWQLETQGVISPNGLEHHTDHDSTLCGMDATGEHWWWPV